MQSHLMPTQVNDLFSLVDQTRFERNQFTLDTAFSSPIVRFIEAPAQTTFQMLDHSADGSIYQVRYSPGNTMLVETGYAHHWSGVLDQFRSWLRFIERELVATERRGGAGVATPEWALNELPDGFNQIRKEIAELQEKERRLRRMAGLLFETGDALTRLVRDTFRGIGFQADITEPGRTYDVTVEIGTFRLLVEVTGIEGQINKQSKKINQVLAALQEGLKPTERVCVAVNACRDRPIADRHDAVVTPEALSLLSGLNAVVFTTTDLFEMWKLSLSDPHRAKAAIERLPNAPAGIYRLSDGRA